MEGRTSSLKEVKCGVPRGSILGPLLFICYINDLPPQCSATVPSIYADDTAIYATGRDPMEVQVKLQNDPDVPFSWFSKNKLSVNYAKSYSMLFTSSQSKYKNDEMNHVMNGCKIDQAIEVKYLGLWLDRTLSFDNRVAKLCLKINTRTKLLWRIRSFITLDLALTLYRSLIEPHLLYCNFILI